MVVHIPPQKTGKDFLSSSHLSLAMDDCYLEDFKKTSHKLDYQPVDVKACRRSPINALAEGNSITRVGHGTETLPCSETKESFIKRGVFTREWNDYSGRLNTNFKSHSDQQCIEFDTTNKVLFDPEKAVQFDPQGQKSLMVSSIQHGDTNLVPFPTSEVRGNYTGQRGVVGRQGRYPPHINYNPSDTLRTDRRFPPTYNTANTDLMTGEFQPAKQQPYGEAALRRGGNSFELKTEREPIFSTNVRDEYSPQEFTTPRYDKPEAVKRVMGTTFVFGTETPFAGDGLSSDTTNRSQFTGTSNGPTLSHKPENVFHSDLPKGDVDPERTRLLQNDTSYAEHFPVRAPGQIVNPKVRGEEIITRSRVDFGRENEQLSSSTRSCYLPQLARAPDRVDQLVKFQNGFSLGSSDVYREPPRSEAKDKYKEASRTFRRFRHSESTLGKLRESHVKISQEAPASYSTSYGDSFQEKIQRPPTLAPKLQTSSIALGGFSRYGTAGY